MISSSDIIEDLDIIRGSINEKFVKKIDPSIAIGDMLESMDDSMSYVRKLYRNNAADRNSIVQPVSNEIDKMIKYLMQAKASLKKSKSNPEDVNNKLDL